MANYNKVTEERKQRFLEAMCNDSRVARACRMAGLSRTTIYDLRRQDATFSAAWDEAINRSRADEWKQSAQKQLAILARRRPKGQAYLYVLRESWRGMVKIGITSNIMSRLAALQSSAPQSLEVLGLFAFRDTMLIERELHEKYMHYRYSGEWFDMPESEIGELLDDLNVRMAICILEDNPNG